MVISIKITNLDGIKLSNRDKQLLLTNSTSEYKPAIGKTDTSYIFGLYKDLSTQRYANFIEHYRRNFIKDRKANTYSFINIGTCTKDEVPPSTNRTFWVYTSIVKFDVNEAPISAYVYLIDINTVSQILVKDPKKIEAQTNQYVKINKASIDVIGKITKFFSSRNIGQALRGLKSFLENMDKSPDIKKYRMNEGWWGCTPMEGDESLDLAFDCMQGFVDKLILEFQNENINKRYAALGVLLRFLNETSNIWLTSSDLDILCSWAMQVRWPMLDNENWKQSWSNPDLVYDWLKKFPKALIIAILRQGRDLPTVLQEWIKDNGLTVKTFMNESTSYFLYTFTKNVPKENVTQKNWLRLFPWDEEGQWVEQQSLLPNEDGYVWKVECPNDSTDYHNVRFISVKPISKI